MLNSIYIYKKSAFDLYLNWMGLQIFMFDRKKSKKNRISIKVEYRPIYMPVV